MRIQVTWKNGALYPVHPLRLKHATVTVDIPEEDIETKRKDDVLPATLENAATALLHKFELIRLEPIPSGVVDRPWRKSKTQ